jgi:SAM-dependent methyltransferase
MVQAIDPAAYEAWYHTPRGAWIGEVEFRLLMQMLRPMSGAKMLDVGSGTGYFSRRLAAAGLEVTGVDVDRAMMDHARRLDGSAMYVEGSATGLPFQDRSFDYVTAITSLCFIDDPNRALSEMWRVCRQTVVLGLLNRHSLLFRQKHGRSGYRGARWDTIKEASAWWRHLRPVPRITVKSAIFFPSGSPVVRAAEVCIPNILPWGGFLVISLSQAS